VFFGLAVVALLAVTQAPRDGALLFFPARVRGRGRRGAAPPRVPEIRFAARTRSHAFRFSAPGHASRARRLARRATGPSKSFSYQNTWAMSRTWSNTSSRCPDAAPRTPRTWRRSRACPARPISSISSSDSSTNPASEAHERWSVNAIFSAVNYSGGFMDGAIEASTRLSASTRTQVCSRAQHVQRHPQSQECATVFLNAHLDGGARSTFGLRYSVAAAPSPWISCWKPREGPIDGQREFLSDRPYRRRPAGDAQRFAGRHAAYLSRGRVRTRAAS